MYFKNINTLESHFITILYCFETDNTQNNCLIYGELTENPAKKFTLKQVFDKIINHAVYGKYVDEFPKEQYSDSISELDLTKYFGEDKRIHDYLPVSDNLFAILSSSVEVNYANKMVYTNWRIDYIDINHPTKVFSSHPLKININDYTKLSYDYSSLEAGYISIKFNCEKPNENNIKKLEYKVKTGTTETDADILIAYNYQEWEEKTSFFSLTSESGDYYTFYKNIDLYLHDNIKDNDVLLYQGYENSFYDYRRAYPAFFADDTIYFYISGVESCIGSGSFNPLTNKLDIYENGIYPELYSNGYIYVSATIFANYSYKRFHIKTPTKTETLSEGNPITYDFPDILYTADGKYIIAIYHYLKDNSHSITIYDSADFKELKTYTFKSAFSTLSKGIITGNNIIIPLESALSGNKALIINLNGL
jgi:hypothetical protein